MAYRIITINKNQIEKYCGNAMLVNMPKGSEYSGYSFFFPLKLIAFCSNPQALKLTIPDDFVFHLTKRGKGKYNKLKVIDQKDVDVDELAEAFGVTMEHNGGLNPYETHKPPEIKVTAHSALPELMDDE